MNNSYLRIRDLRVHFHGRSGHIRAVDGLDLDLARGERFGLIGESGSGKTMVALSLLGLLSAAAQISGSISLAGQELVGLGSQAMRTLRGREMAMIFEQPAAYLNPLLTIGQQISETVQAHTPLSRKDVRKRTLELLSQVHMPRPDRSVHMYPFELSGGMQQRAMIAIALAGRPNLLLADEPTTALDPTVRAHILALLEALMQETDLTLLLISHDLAAVRRLCRYVAVMYAGRIVETGSMEDVLDFPHHPYTKTLVRSLSGRVLQPIVGNAPSLADLPSGCRFHPRCSMTTARCIDEEPSLHNGIRCHFRHAA